MTGPDAATLRPVPIADHELNSPHTVTHPPPALVRVPADRATPTVRDPRRCRAARTKLPRATRAAHHSTDRAVFAAWAISRSAATAVALRRARAGRVGEHRAWMLRSFALALVFMTFDLARMALAGVGLPRTFVSALGLLLSATAGGRAVDPSHAKAASSPVSAMRVQSATSPSGFGPGNICGLPCGPRIAGSAPAW